MTAWGRLATLFATVDRRPGNVSERQRAWLLNCLSRNEDTNFGRQHHFSSLKTVSDYQKAVPTSTHETFLPYVNRIAEGEPDVLFQGEAVAFEKTSGSASGRKIIPYSRESLSDIRSAVFPWLGHLISSYSLSDGSLYWAASPWPQSTERTISGKVIGLREIDYLGSDAAACLSELTVGMDLSPELQTSEWGAAVLSRLLARRDLVFISLWSPTFLLSLLDHLPAGVDTRDLWPQLRLISCWADGASAPFFKELQLRFPHCAFEPKGLFSTEGPVSIPDASGKPVLTADSGFYEFLDDQGRVLLAEDLGIGDRAEVVMTTAGGLYRFRTGDMVRCEGFSGDLPALRFIGRSTIVSDLVGEKLTDAFVASCFDGFSGFAMLAPAGALRPGYSIIIDRRAEGAPPDLEYMEQRLVRNPHYAYARRIGQLRPLSLVSIDRPRETYLRYAIQKGQRVGDIKIPALCPDPVWYSKPVECHS